MITKKLQPKKCRVVNPSPNRHIYNAASALRLWDYCGMGGGKRKKNEEVWCEIVSLSYVREVVLYKVSPTWIS